MTDAYGKLSCLPRRERHQVTRTFETEADDLKHLVSQRRVVSAAIDHVGDHRAKRFLGSVGMRLNSPRDLGDGEVIVDKVNLCFFVTHNGIVCLQV